MSQKKSNSQNSEGDSGVWIRLQQSSKRKYEILSVLCSAKISAGKPYKTQRSVTNVRNRSNFARLARQGAHQSCQNPESYLGVPRKQTISALKECSENNMNKSWRNGVGCSQVKKMIGGFNPARTNWFIGNNRKGTKRHLSPIRRTQHAPSAQKRKIFSPFTTMSVKVR